MSISHPERELGWRGGKTSPQVFLSEDKSGKTVGGAVKSPGRRVWGLDCRLESKR